MPGGRRNLSRSGSGRPPQPIYPNDDIKSRFGLQCDGVSSKVVSPRHIPLPTLPHDSGLMFESIMFIYTAMSTFLQFLHLYRSVWWLPQSYTRYSMNFYLIDPYLVGFIVSILGRRLMYSLLSQAVTRWAPASIWTVMHQLVRLLLLGVVLASLVWCTYNIMQNHPIVNIFYLCYPAHFKSELWQDEQSYPPPMNTAGRPMSRRKAWHRAGYAPFTTRRVNRKRISVYFILFGLSVSPFFDVMSLPPLTTEESKAAARILGKPLHSCSMSPQTIREEVDYLKTDFNIRMKQVLFSSVLNAYYAGFVPCCFAQNFLYYDIFWATQHLTFVWLGCFTMYLVHCYPVKYCDTLHRAALHLGKWARVEGRTMHLPSHVWADSTLWHQGALVKHCKELYKAEGISNAAEPGNTSHTRFYLLFNNPAVPLCTVVGLQLSLVALQVVILVRASEWYQVVSLALLLFANYYTLFKLSRDYLVCWKVYKAEAMIQDKITGG